MDLPRGNHTILKGDCREMLSVLPADSVQLVITSPPYNTGWHYSDDGSGDRLPLNEYLALLASAFKGCHRVLHTGGILALNLPPTTRQHQIRAYPVGAWAAWHLYQTGWLMREPIVWIKSKHELMPIAPGTAIGHPSNPYLRATHEYVILASKGSYTIPGKSEWPDVPSYLDWCKDTWAINPKPGRLGLPLSFPEELVSRLVLLFSEPGDIVLDPFAGLGTTGRVASLYGRVAWLIEKNPAYWERLEAAIGQGVMSFT